MISCIVVYDFPAGSSIPTLGQPYEALWKVLHRYRLYPAMLYPVYPFSQAFLSGPGPH
jgi:hypothetical protein